MEVCYACEREATSVEHTPPKCIFPELKDFPYKSLRKNLITVPSCDQHNSAKSKDDEFLMISLAGMLGNNSIGYIHSITKVDRALRRSSYKFLERIFVSNRKRLRLDIGDNKFIDAIAGTPDLERLSSCFEHIALSIHRHHFSKNFNGKIKTLANFLVIEHQGRSNLQRFLLARAKKDTQGLPRHGENQEVFFYQVVNPDAHGIFLINLCFFDNVEVFCALIPHASTVPTHLGFELIKHGMPVTFTLDDNEFPVHIE